MEYLTGMYHMSVFYLRHLGTLRSLPDEVARPAETLPGRLRTGAPFDVKVPGWHRKKYNADMAELKGRMRALAGTRTRTPFTRLMGYVFAVRLATVAAAATGNLGLTFCVSLLQFVLAPYSFFASLTTLIALFPPLFAGYYLTFAPLAWFVGLVPIPDWIKPYTELEIGLGVVVGFVVVDQLACAVCLMWTHRGEPKPVTPSRLWQSLWFGFLNAKTYHLVVLLLARGSRISLLMWAVDAVFGISTRVCDLVSRATMTWAALFYHQHRIAHLPVVYTHAHKFHHFLTDSTPFDAHAYGSGAPEEWHTLMLEALPAVMWGVPPACLSWHVLRNSWGAKVDHTRKVTDASGYNRHVDHHLYHTKNYATDSPVLDMYMGTCTNNDWYELPGYTVVRRPASQPAGSGSGGRDTTDSGDVVFEFRPVSTSTSQ